MRYLLFLLIIGLFMACQSSSSTQVEKKQTKWGYDYVLHVDKEGPGPQAGDKVTFEIYQRKGDSIINSSKMNKRPGELILPEQKQHIKRSPNPLTEALYEMSVGDSLTVWYPVDSMPRPPRGFENEKYMIYDMVLLNIKSKAEQEAEKQALIKTETSLADDTRALIDKYKSGSINSDLKETKSGLKYIIHEQGSGAKPQNGSMVHVHYTGMLLDGTPFDNSYKRGVPYNFLLGQGRVIKGWDEGIALLNQGGKATLFVPSELGYGAAGKSPSITANAELVFHVSLEKVQ